MHPTTSAKVKQRLEELGVNVELGKKVESATAEGLMVSGRPLESHTIIWTSGVANHPFYKANEMHFDFAPNGKIIVNEYMRTKDGIYIIGDNAATPFSGLAQTALHDAQFLGRNFKLRQANKPLKKYKAIMPPVVVPLGEDWAVFEWKKLRLSGWLASLLRRAADVIGYSDVLPLGRALGVWRAQKEYEADYFTPTASGK
jgi:NADH dehydrogenase